MTNRNLREAPRPLLIAGRVQNAADLALRRILHAKSPKQPIIMVDYQGHLANHLTEHNKCNIHKSPLTWLDLANRRRPVALFRFARSTGIRVALRNFFFTCIREFTMPVSTATVDAVVELAYRIADQGAVGLGAIHTALNRPEITQFLRGNATLTNEVDQISRLLAWALRFPAVWALSEGNNRIDLHRQFRLGATIWIEVPGSHMEKWEHQLVGWMVDAVLTDILLSAPPSQELDGNVNGLIVVHGFPTLAPAAMTVAPPNVKSVGVFAFSAKQQLPPTAKPWLDAAADLWITGEIGQLPTNKRTGFLTETERARIQTLERGQVWVRSGLTKKAVTTLVRKAEPLEMPARAGRLLAAKRLTQSPVKQFCSASRMTQSCIPRNASIYNKLCATETLMIGWHRVKGHNKHSQGCDQVTIAQFGAMLDRELRALSQELTEGRYQCRPLRAVHMRKPDGGTRTIKIPCVRDRVVQGTVLHLIEPLFEPIFSPSSFAYRPGRGAHHAVGMARSIIASGKHYVVAADIKKCFDTIDHEVLIRLVSDVVSDKDILALISNWLKVEFIDFQELWPSEVGVPQGGAISPLLANIYLDPLDKELAAAGHVFVRYADDYVIICDTEAHAQAAMRMMEAYLRDTLRLALKPAKSSIRHIDQGVEFLGFELYAKDVRIPINRIDTVTKEITMRLNTIAAHQTPGLQKYELLLNVNAIVRGIRNYFAIDNAPSLRRQMEELDIQLDELAQDLIPHTSDIRTAWIARDRFAPDLEEVTRQLQTHAEVALFCGSYAVDWLRDKESLPLGGVPIPDLADPKADQAETVVPAVTNEEDGADADVLMLDGRLHVMAPGCYVTVKGTDVLVKRKRAEVFKVAISDVSLAYLEGRGIAVSAELTMRLCEADIPVVFTPLIGAPSAVAQPVHVSRSNVRQQQAVRRNDPDILRTGFQMLAAKVANQASVLKYYARYRKKTDLAVYTSLTHNADEIRNIAGNLSVLDPIQQVTRATVMGFEGRAAAMYWGAISALVPAHFEFPGRHTKGATDRVNSAVNYLYGILYGEVWRAVVRVGLDPYFGIIHGAERDNGSLIFDLIEEYRAPFADRVILGLLGRGFEIRLDKHGLLHTDSRRKLVRAFQKQWRRPLNWRGKLRKPIDILSAQVASLKNAFLGKEDYQPFRFRW